MRVELPLVSFISAALVLSSLLWHWRARSIPTLSLIFWLAVIDLTHGINAIIWAGNTLAHALFWCEISKQDVLHHTTPRPAWQSEQVQGIMLEMAAHHAYAASTVCMCRNLSQVCSPYYTIPSAAQRRTRLIIEIFMCAVWPIIGMALHIAVQGRQFNIVKDFGCEPRINPSLPAVLLIYLPPIVCSLVALVYSAISLRWLVHWRTRFHTALPPHPSSLTTKRYLWLVSLSITMIISVTAMTIFVFVLNLTENGPRAWTIWDYVYKSWELEVSNFFDPASEPGSTWERYHIVWYMVPFTSVIFFAFFGLGQKIKAEYTKYASFVKTKILRIKLKEQIILPVSANSEINRASPR